MSRSTTRFVKAFLGLTGSGKTFLAEKLLGAYLRPVIIPDVMNEWGSFGKLYTSPDALVEEVGLWLGEEIPLPAPGGVFVLKGDSTAKVKRLFSLASELGVPGTYLCDEFHRYAPSNKVTPFLEMIRTGRHYSQSIVGITQRPQSVHNHAIEEASICSFALSGRAAEHVTEYMPQGVTSEGLRKLEPRHYVLGGRYGQFPDRMDLGDADGSVWTYNDDTHEVQKVRDAL